MLYITHSSDDGSRNRKGKKTLLFSILGIVGLMLSSCSDRQMTKADLQGTWVAEKSSQHWIKAEEDRTKCQIILRTDGTFAATVPDYLLSTPDECSGRIMVGKGRWALTSDMSDASLKLLFSEIEGNKCDWGATPLHIIARNELVFWVDYEGGERFIFVRSSVPQSSSDAK